MDRQKLVTETIGSFPAVLGTLCVLARKRMFRWFISGQWVQRSEQTADLPVPCPNPSLTGVFKVCYLTMGCRTYFPRVALHSGFFVTLLGRQTTIFLTLPGAGSADSA